MALKPEEAKALTEQGLQALTEDADQWQKWAKTYAKFPSYSPGNILMILQQRPDATRVAGFHAWQELGRTVKKGEHGIGIYAPLITRAKKGEKEDPAPTLAPEKAQDDEKKLIGFRVVYVFDVAQTEGKALEIPKVPLLHGGDFAQMWQRLAGESPVPVEEQPIEKPGLMGFYEPLRGAITINAAQSPNQKLATLLHELGHYAGLPPGQTPRIAHKGQEEVIAEVTGFVLSERLGLDTKDQSLHYTAMNALGDRQAVLATMSAVQERVGKLLPLIDHAREAQQAHEPIVPRPIVLPDRPVEVVQEARQQTRSVGYER